MQLYKPDSDHAPGKPVSLSSKHRRMLLEESGISPEVAAERGYYTARRGADVPQDRGKLLARPGLVVPMFSPDGITRSYQLRPDRKGKGPKYWSASGRPMIVDVHPRTIEEVRHGDSPLLITEGAKTGDAATSRGIPTLVLAGVSMWNAPGVKPKKLRPCFDHVRLRGRLVIVGFDSDCMSKANVQRELAELVPALEERGAVVKVLYLPDAPDGSKLGIDDYLAGGYGTITEMFALARKFEPTDFGKIRMSRDQKLQAAVRYLWRRWREGDWMHFEGAADKGNWQRGHTARDAMEALIVLAPQIGKLDGCGVVVEVGLRRLSELAAKSAPSVGAAMKHLEADGQLEILPATDKAKPHRYRLLVPSAALYSMERDATRESLSGESDPRCKGLRCPSAPRLRWSSPARSGRLVRRVEPATGRTVTEAVGENVFVHPDHRPYAKRLGPHRCAVLDALEAAGGELHLKDLCEALHRKRPWDVRRRILKPLEEAGIIECEGDVIRLAAEWQTSLDARREEDGEIEQAERQVKKHRTDGETYRLHLERQKHGTPEASLAAVRRTQDLRERRLREAREEEERRRAPVPSAVKALVVRILSQHERVRMGLLCGIAADEGLHALDVPRAVESLGYRVERLPEFENAEFIFAKEAAA